jgi:hypothetical protein
MLLGMTLAAGGGAQEIENVLAAATPGGIEAQEAREQRRATGRQDRLPRYHRDPAFYDERAKANTLADEAETRATAESFGFTYGKEIDDLFVNVTFPPGWEMRADDHSMWSTLYDEQGRKRGSMFYKGAFYDRSATVSFWPRYVVEQIRPANWYELNSPRQLTERVQVRRTVRDDDDRYRDNGRHPGGAMSTRDYMAAKKNGYPHVFEMDEYGNAYPAYGYPPKPRTELVWEEVPLPDDQQPKPVAYETYFAYIDRATGRELWRGKTYESPYEGQVHEDPVEARARSHYAVEKMRKKAANEGMEQFITMHGADLGAGEWLIERPVPMLNADGSVAPLPFTRLDRDYTTFDECDAKLAEIRRWAKCVNATVYARKDSYFGGFEVWFAENWMKVAFEQRFGFRTNFREKDEF